MKACVILLAAAFLSQAAIAGDSQFQFKGYAKINQIVRERLIRDSESFELDGYLGETLAGPATPGGSLLDLLGSYTGGNVNSEFHNGVANPVNMILWHVLFSGLAGDVGALCGPGEGGAPPGGPLAKVVTTDFYSQLAPICAWPAPEARQDAALFGFWLALTRFDEPQEEFQAWKAYFLSGVYQGASPSQTVADMVMAAWMNPNFLLRN